LWRLGAVEAVILADHDAAGEHHAEAVAAVLAGYSEVPTLADDAEEPWASWTMAEPGDPELAPLRAKVVRLPDLPPSGDVADYLDAGHSRADLLAVVDITPFWTPALRASQRLDRKRAQTRERVRRHRQQPPHVTQRISKNPSSCNTESQRYALQEPALQEPASRLAPGAPLSHLKPASSPGRALVSEARGLTRNV
jgi:hypothetical protein